MPYNCPMKSMAVPAIVLLLASCSSTNLRRACAMQPASVTPSATAGLVAAVVVAHQATAPVAEEGSCVLAGAGLGEVVDHRASAARRRPLA